MDQKQNQQNTFKTPEEAAKQDQASSVDEHPHLDDELAATGQKPKPSRKKRFHLTKKQWTSVGIAAVIVLIGGGYLAWKLTRPDTAAPVATVDEPAPAPAPTDEQSKLTGVKVPVGTNDNTPVTAVMIENSPDARPQSGLRDAGVVYEAIAEGGITRFVAFYQESNPDYIGPVRSVRPYYLDFVKPYDAAIAHAGGSGQALAEIASGGFKDLDYTVAGGAYQRVSTRYAPHNLYTSRPKLLAEHKARGWTKSDFTGMGRTEEPGKPATKTTAKTITLAVSSHLYNSSYTYDKASNKYRRTMAGQPHTDEKSGKQITPDVVVALVMNHSYAGIYSVYKTTGSGEAYIYQNGEVIRATWKKPNRATQLSLVDANGKDIQLNPGQTWFTLVANNNQISHKP